MSQLRPRSRPQYSSVGYMSSAIYIYTVQLSSFLRTESSNVENAVVMGSPQRASHIYRIAILIPQNRSRLALKMQSSLKVLKERPIYTEQPSLFLRTSFFENAVVMGRPQRASHMYTGQLSLFLRTESSFFENAVVIRSPQRASHIYRTVFFILQNISRPTLKMQTSLEVLTERPIYTEQPSLFLRTLVVLL